MLRGEKRRLLVRPPLLDLNPVTAEQSMLGLGGTIETWNFWHVVSSFLKMLLMCFLDLFGPEHP